MYTRSIPFLLSLALGLSAAACEKDSKAFDPGDYPKNVGDPPVVVMSGAGKSATQTLRIKPAVGTKQALDMNVKMSMDGPAGAVMGDIGMNMKMGAEVTKLDQNGDFHTDVEFLAMSVDNPQMAGLGLENLLKGMKVSQVTSERGFMKEGKVDLPDSLAMLKPMFADSMKQMALALPEGGVGVGSSWTTKETLEKNGIRIYQEVKFTVTGMDKGQAQLSMTLKQRALEQTMEMMGMSAKVKKLESSGSGKVTLAFDKPMPLSMELSMKVLTEISMQDQNVSMNVKMDMNMTSN